MALMGVAASAGLLPLDSDGGGVLRSSTDSTTGNYIILRSKGSSSPKERGDENTGTDHALQVGGSQIRKYLRRIL